MDGSIYRFLEGLQRFQILSGHRHIFEFIPISARPGLFGLGSSWRIGHFEADLDTSTTQTPTDFVSFIAFSGSFASS
jgi:hypothetical protein